MLKLQYFGQLIQRANSLEKTLMLVRWKAGGEGDSRGWDGWMALLTQWTWVGANSRRWWRTGKPGVLLSVGSQRVREYWATEQQQWACVWMWVCDRVRVDYVQMWAWACVCLCVWSLRKLQRRAITGKQMKGWNWFLEGDGGGKGVSQPVRKVEDDWGGGLGSLFLFPLDSPGSLDSEPGR